MRWVYGDITGQLSGRPTEASPLMAEGLTIALAAAGLAVLALWLWRFGGPNALTRSPQRRHCLPVWLPFAVFFVWLVSFSVLTALVDRICDDSPEAFAAGVRNGVVLALNLAMIAGMMAIAYRMFARRLKGFGIDLRTLPQDAGWATAHLLAVYPLVIGAVLAVTSIGRLFQGEDFMIETHQSLEELRGFEGVWGRVLVIVLVTAVVPVMEEMLFRGLIQTALRTALPGPWTAILMTSALFAAVHSHSHALAIFALSCGLGYAYERSGSLLRPMAIHFLFNAASVTAMLLWSG